MLSELSYLNCDKDIPFFPSHKAKVIKVYDGDTCTLAKINPNNETRGLRYSGRLYGIDTAEIKGTNLDEKNAAHYSKEVLSKLILDQIVDIEIKGIDKYGRILVKLSVGEICDVSEYMLKNGLAIEYDGTKKKIPDWKLLLDSVK